MDNALMIGMQNQMVLQRRMDAVANNLANVTTTGFKADSFVFQQDVEDPAHSTEKPNDIRFVAETGISRDMTQGQVQLTGNPLDVAVQGEGFFAVQGDNGTLYTRDGSFTMAADGTIVTQDGRKVLSDSGSPITLDPHGETPVIDSDGAITVGGVEAGKLGVYKFGAPEGLQKVGDNLYAPAGQSAAPVADAKVVQGALEGSNVRPVIELARMIEISRAYESASKMVGNDDDLRKTTIDRLGKAAA